MARYNYERLSFQDNSFLIMETPNVHMHVASTLVFEAGPLRREDGGVDFKQVKRSIVDVLHRIPRYRQRLHWIPLDNHAVWVDDPHFDVDYHVRHAALPRPGTPEQLKKLSARIMAQQLDRKRPLWETWVVEGLDDGESFALITKIHHCMIDGASGTDLAHVLLSTSPEPSPPGERPAFMPRPAPHRSDLLRDELVRRFKRPFQLISNLGALGREFEELRDEISTRASAVLELAGMAGGADETPLNGKVGPHRKFDWLEVPLDDLKEIRRAWGCTINDVVLTIVTSAVREYLIHRAVDPTKINFRVSAPVSVRTEEDRGQMGNRVSTWMVDLPIAKKTPKEQLTAIHAETQRLKETRQALGVETMMAVAEWTPSVLMSLGAQSMGGQTNSIVTNVPGPQVSLYCQGARLKAIYPQVPLLENLGLGIALMSYAGKVCWGFNSDPELVPDADVFVEKIREAIDSVRAAAAAEPKPKLKKKAAKPAPIRAATSH
ncbi:MAG: wax ester/triacylglycerol synthase family O-acyltransferase [Deltaproteobacteria bacterium]|nr:wax ester/triacylglycerol synthase family O-acyltransferase [Deltaproteobacteria bacterium]MBW2361301.1 wax ester/triacylglycerol synthase family O-acyltransferase [Deltaproteobacteria bacterium]